ncbi:MAG: right-handed parallel beta-helix repeat-containing protein, partial [Planctomycetales bacterium]|nr:right-handed parallel beta-helix repeat-containing protein [Planctomycetales bacterium]
RELATSIESLECRRLLTAGPRVIDQFPGARPATAAALSKFQLTFDMPVDLTTIDSSDVSLTNPLGESVNPVQLVPDVDSGGLDFYLTFPAQTTRGDYRLSLGPDVSDLNGNMMNQDNDALNGETNGQDIYRSTVTYASIPLALPAGDGELFHESFEDWNAIPNHWSFSTNPGGSIAVSGEHGPHGGNQHLISTAFSSNVLQTATLAIDASAHAESENLFVDFWANRSISSQTSQDLRIELSADGSRWREVSRLSLTNEPTNYVIDLDKHAASQGISLDDDVYIRFRHNSYSSIGQPFALDDVRISAGAPSIRLDIGGNDVSESSGMDGLIATVSRGNTLDSDQDLEIFLSSSNASELTVPESVTIPAGARSVTFQLVSVDDNVLDGPQTVTVQATAADYGSASSQVRVLDSEDIGVNVAAQTIGDRDVTTVTISRGDVDDLSQPVLVSLNVDDPTVAQITRQVVIPAGQKSVHTELHGIPGAVRFGVRKTQITATADGFEPGTNTVFVQDGSQPSLVFYVPEESAPEGGDSVVAQILRPVGALGDILVNIESSPPGQLVHADTVAIPSGENSASVELTPSNDGMLDGDVLVSITAFVDPARAIASTDILTVRDDDTIEARTIGGPLTGVLESSEYQVVESVSVLSDTQLSLTAGSSLQFAAGTELSVYGSLVAIGTEDAPVGFTSALPEQTPGDWQGIKFLNDAASASTLDHVDVEFAQTAITITRAPSEGIRVSNSTIRNNKTNGIYASGNINSSVVLEGNSITSNGETGVYLRAYASGCTGSSNSTTVRNNDISENGATGISLVGSGSSIHGCIPSRSGSVTALIEGNYIHDNANDGVFGGAYNGYHARGSVRATIRNNLITKNEGNGLRFTGDGYSFPVVVHNTIVGNTGAGMLHGEGLASVHNNIFVGNRSGIEAAGDATLSIDQVTHNLFHENVNGSFVNYQGSPADTVTVNVNGTPADTSFNIFVDPAFKSETDFHLRLLSPAIDAGTQDSVGWRDIDGDQRSFPADIGYDEFSDGNPNLPGDVTGNGRIDAADIDAINMSIRTDGEYQNAYDLNEDKQVDRHDVDFLISNILDTSAGDADLDGRFDSTDFVVVFQAGEYEDAEVGNSTWAEGDWNGDGDFTTVDLVLAFQAATYESSLAKIIPFVADDELREREIKPLNLKSRAYAIDAVFADGITHHGASQRLFTV